MKKSLILLTLILFTGLLSSAQEISKIDLSGEWHFSLDEKDEGISQQWFKKNLAGRIKLPGTTGENKIGKPETGSYQELNKQTIYHFREFFSFVGSAWYQKEISIPKGWENKRITLFLEKTSFSATVWVNDKRIGEKTGLAAPKVYDLSEFLVPGKRIRLSVRIDNRDMFRIKNHNGTGSHAYGTETQPRWNGIIGKIYLSATDKVWLEKVDVYPDIHRQKITLKVKTGNLTDKAQKVHLNISAASTNTAEEHRVPDHVVEYNVAKGMQENSFTYTMGAESLLWDEHIPALYNLQLVLSAGGLSDEKRESFAMREFKAQGNFFTINGSKTMMRGTIDCAIFPLTGYSPMDVDFYMDIYQRYKDHGINHIRYHSWCPPKAAFIAADRLGLYLEPEGPNMWGKTMAEDDDNFNFYKSEAIRVIESFGNHPSFCMYSNGNETRDDIELMSDITSTLKEQDKRHLYTINTAIGFTKEGGDLPVNDFVIAGRYRGNIWGSGDYSKVLEFYKVPLLHHEIGQWQVFPDLREIPLYTGVMRPFNMEAIRYDLERKGMCDQVADFVYASGMLSLRLYRAEIESSLRTRDFAGFQMLGMQDYPGYGLATDGIWTPLYRSKGLITASEYKKFCGSTVLLTDFSEKHKNYIFQNNQAMECKVLAAHFLRKGLVNQEVCWNLKDAQGALIISGTIPDVDIPVGSGTELGNITVDLSAIKEAKQLNLTLSLKDTDISNSWKIWVYPKKYEITENDLLKKGNILIASGYTEEVREHLQKGGNVLLLPELLDPEKSHLLPFKPVFWAAPLWGHKPERFNHSLGLCIESKHPVFKHFPTDTYSEHQWSELLEQSRSCILDDFPKDFHPMIRVIPNGYRNFRRSNLFEVKVGKGNMLICSMNLDKDLKNRPAAGQLRYSILNYMAGKDFDPETQIPEEKVAGFFWQLSNTKLGTKIKSVSSEQKNYSRQYLIDGNSITYWSSQYNPKQDLPQSVVLELPKPTSLLGVRYLPRQDVATGRITKYAIHISSDGKQWGEPILEGKLPSSIELQELKFKHVLNARFIKFTALDAVNGVAAIAELDLITD